MLSVYRVIYNLSNIVSRYALHKQTAHCLSELTSRLSTMDVHPFLQPIFCSRDEKIIGCEVLLRLRENKEYISPVGFIHEIEHTELMNKITCELLDKISNSLFPCSFLLPEGFYFSFNLSVFQVRDSFVINSIVNFSKLFSGKANLVIEIVERNFLEFDEGTIRNMDALMHSGIRFAIDDFCAGASSLKYIEYNGFSTIKIDRTLTVTFEGRLAYSRVIMAIVSLAKSSNLTVIAEGVEDEEQKNLLKQAGICALQGYYLENPMELSIFKQKYLNWS